MIKSIKAFWAVVEHKNISAAAQALNYAQPVISTHLTQLEKTLGVQLVCRNRGKREITLTPAGEAFIPLAQRFLELDKQLSQYINSQHNEILRLAASNSAHELVVSHITNKLLRRNQKIEVRLSNVEIRELENAILDKTFDVAIMHGAPPKLPHITTIPLFLEERYILCPNDTPLPDRPLSPQDLDPAFEIVYTNPSGTIVPEWRKENFPTEQKPFFMVSSLMSIHSYMSDPRCWSVVPAGVVMYLITANPNKLTFRLLDNPPEPRLCSAIIQNISPNSKIVQEMLTCFNDFVEERPYLKKFE